MAIGVRRIHVLPTPLSSFTSIARSEAAAQALRQHPLLEELAARMKTKIMTRAEPTLGNVGVQNGVFNGSLQALNSLPGVSVIGTDQDPVAETRWLLERGAAEIFLLPNQVIKPKRVLIHWTQDQARRATLAVAASVLRHVPAEATYLGIMPASTPEAQRHSGMRDLLDARSEAQAVHGLDMRTELHLGDAAEELAKLLAQAPEQILILGISDPKQLTDEFAGLLRAATNSAVLIVCRPSDVARLNTKVA